MLWLCLIAAATGVSLVPVSLNRIVVVIGLAIQVVFFGNWVGFFNSPGPLLSDVYRVQGNSFVFRRVGIYYHHLPPFLFTISSMGHHGCRNLVPSAENPERSKDQRFPLLIRFGVGRIIT